MGIMLSASGAKYQKDLRSDLVGGLQNITESPLKPHQRLKILKQFLLPRYLHEFVLAPVGDGWLKWLYTSIRSNVRRWLNLLVTLQWISFMRVLFDGGLGISSLRYTIHVMKRRRLDNVLSAADPIPPALFGSSFKN